MSGSVRLLQVGLILTIVMTAGCGRNWKLEVESNTTWSGNYGTVSGSSYSSASVEGRGSRTFDIQDDDVVCASFYQTGDGYVKVTIKDDGGFLGIGEDPKSVETNASGGYAEVCTEGTLP